MPDYTFRDPRSNRTITLRGDSPPTEAELQQIFAGVNAEPTPMPAAASAGMMAPSTKERIPVPLGVAGKMFIGAGERVEDIVGGILGVPSAALRNARALYKNPTQELAAYPGRALTGITGVVTAPFSAAADLVSGDARRAGGGLVDLATMAPSVGPLSRLATAGAKNVARGVGKTFIKPRLTPAEADAVVWARAQGIEIDPATATGSKPLRSLQSFTEKTLGGAGQAQDFRMRQAGQVEQAGRDLTARVGRQADTPLSAVEAATGKLDRRINAQARVADEAYGKFRAGATGVDVDISASKASLRPLYVDLLRQSKLSPLHGGKASSLVALDRLMNGPDVVPLPIVESVLGDLKSMARTADPGVRLRTSGQGVAARAVQTLQEQVDAAAQQLNPGTWEALQRGRSATRGKYATASVRKTLKGEPAAIFQRLVAGKDTGLNRLRALKAEAPREVIRIGRAYLEDLMDKATAEGGFKRTDGLWADWQRMGPETKALLYGQEPGLIKALDNFFLVAKRIGENANPSGTAGVLNATQAANSPLSWTLGKLLYSPSGARALTRGFNLSLTASASGAFAGALADIEKAAQGLAVDEDDQP